MCYANSDSSGNLLFAIGTFANISTARRAMYQQTRLALPAWQIQDVMAWNDILSQGEVGLKSFWAKTQMALTKNDEAAAQQEETAAATSSG